MGIGGIGGSGIGGIGGIGGSGVGGKGGIVLGGNVAFFVISCFIWLALETHCWAELAFIGGRLAAAGSVAVWSVTLMWPDWSSISQIEAGTVFRSAVPGYGFTVIRFPFCLQCLGRFSKLEGSKLHAESGGAAVTRNAHAHHVLTRSDRFRRSFVVY